MSNANTQSTKVKTGKVRFSYANVWEAKRMTENGKPSGEPKFSVVILIPKKDKTTKAILDAGIEAAKVVGRDTKAEWKSKIPAKLEVCLHDGDEKFEEDAEKYAVHKGHWYINAKANANRPPQIVKLVDGRIEAIVNRDEFYSGCYGKATLNFFPYYFMGKAGIGCGLNNLLKTEDGENLGGGYSNAETDFADEVEENDDL
jgi:hypothetical protein